MCDLIVSVPDHCLSFYFTTKLMIILMDHETRMQYCFLAVILSYMYPA